MATLVPACSPGPVASLAKGPAAGVSTGHSSGEGPADPPASGRGDAPPAVSAPARSAPARGCETASGYRGLVLGQPIYARLAQDGSRLYGRYFYEKVGVDIALNGSASADLSVVLTEGRPDAPTGRFAGACDPKSGAIQGTWSGAHASGPFSFGPIGPSDVPLVAQKRFSLKRKSTGAGDSDVGECSYTEVVLEFFGLRNQQLERKLNHESLAPAPGPWLAPRRADQARECVHSFQGEMTESILTLQPDIVAIERGGFGVVGRMAHPLNGSEFEPITMSNYDVRTGAMVALGDVFAKDPIPLAVACALRVGGNAAGLDCTNCPAPSGDDWQAALERHLFFLKATGVAFFADGFPHVSGVFNGHGPTLSYAVLLRDGYLRSDSPVRHLWEHVTPAIPSAEACPGGHEKEWWN